LLIDKHAGVSSFGIIEALQRQVLAREPERKRRDLPKMGHGGTLDPFATGLLTICVGPAVKLARYFLGSIKTYEATVRFGETTIPGDPTDPISERSAVLPESREQIQALATRLTLQPYLQIPPMHSAKKVGGKPLYELARQGKEIEREPKSCLLHEFEILSYDPATARARIRVRCSAGTYIRTLAQDLGRLLGTVAMLDDLRRTGSGWLEIPRAWTVDQIGEALAKGKKWDEMDCWIPFNRLLESYDRAEATPEEARALLEGKQVVLPGILKRVERREHVALNSADLDADDYVAIFSRGSLIAVARCDQGAWSLERAFTGS
jgi:tRNA pseudouridine55 synthase